MVRAPNNAKPRERLNAVNLTGRGSLANLDSSAGIVVFNPTKLLITMSIFVVDMINVDQ